MNDQNVPPETLQRLIDYAHAAMVKRPDTPDEYPMNQSRRGDQYAIIYAKDLRELQKLGKPSWEQSE
jgi:hypothetical protein